MGWLSFGIILLRYVMTTVLYTDMNIHVYEAYSHGYQIVYKTLEFRGAGTVSGQGGQTFV